MGATNSSEVTVAQIRATYLFAYVSISEFSYLTLGKQRGLGTRNSN